MTTMTQPVVLVIDDSSDIHDILYVRLKPEDVVLHRAMDAKDGLARARDLLPDLILLDIDMPGMSGLELCQKLKQDGATASIPIIFLTARAEFRDRARGLDIGGVDYITKPFNPLELAPLVRDLLSRIERGERDQLRREKLADLRALMEE